MTAGSCDTAAGVPSAISRPWCSTMIRSAMLITARRTCSTKMTAMFSAFRPCTIAAISSTSSGDRPPITSSSKTTRGSVASTRTSSSFLRAPSGSSAAGASSHCVSPARSNQRRARAESPRPLSWPNSSATSTFSRTLKLAKGCGIWKLRAMPRRQRTLGLSRVMSRPSRWMWPPEGSRAPEMMLKSVVLPAPFGPMRHKISPLNASNETPSSTTSPPKLCRTLSAVRMGRLFKSLLLLGRRSNGDRPRGGARVGELLHPGLDLVLGRGHVLRPDDDVLAVADLRRGDRDERRAVLGRMVLLIEDETAEDAVIVGGGEGLDDRLGGSCAGGLEGVESDGHAVVAIGVVGGRGGAELGPDLFVEYLVGRALRGVEDERRPHQAFGRLARAPEIGSLGRVIDCELGGCQALFGELLRQRDAGIHCGEDRDQDVRVLEGELGERRIEIRAAERNGAVGDDGPATGLEQVCRVSRDRATVVGVLDEKDDGLLCRRQLPTRDERGIGLEDGRGVALAVEVRLPEILEFLWLLLDLCRDRTAHGLAAHRWDLVLVGEIHLGDGHRTREGIADQETDSVVGDQLLGRADALRRVILGIFEEDFDVAGLAVNNHTAFGIPLLRRHAHALAKGQAGLCRRSGEWTGDADLHRLLGPDHSRFSGQSDSC